MRGALLHTRYTSLSQNGYGRCSPNNIARDAKTPVTMHLMQGAGTYMGPRVKIPLTWRWFKSEASMDQTHVHVPWLKSN